MKHHNCDPLCSQRKKGSFQTSVYQTVPHLSSKCECPEEVFSVREVFAGSMFTMNQLQKNVSTEPGDPIDFSENDIMQSKNIQRIFPGQYQLSEPGLYYAQFQLSLLHPGQLIISIDHEEQPGSVVGTSADGGPVFGFHMFRTDHPNAVFSIQNPLQNTKPVIVASYAGGVMPVTADLLLLHIA